MITEKMYVHNGTFYYMKKRKKQNKNTLNFELHCFGYLGQLTRRDR